MPAMAKVLSDSPAIHASAHVLTAAILRNWLSIVPSSGTELNFRHALARNAGQQTFKARAALCGSSVIDCQKMKRLARTLWLALINRSPVLPHLRRKPFTGVRGRNR